MKQVVLAMSFLLFFSFSVNASEIEYLDDSIVTDDVKNKVEERFQELCRFPLEFAESLIVKGEREFRTRYSKGFEYSVLAKYDDVPQFLGDKNPYFREKIQVRYTIYNSGQTEDVFIGGDSCNFSGIYVTEMKRADYEGDSYKDLNSHDSLDQLFKDKSGVMGHYRLKFKVMSIPYFNSAARVAQYAWSKIFPDTRVDPPVPCGAYKVGQFSMEGHDNSYRVLASGDGYGNTCLGSAWPGDWSEEVQVTFNPSDQTGTIEINAEAE